MFMETLKGIVVNLVTVLIFISAIELIMPSNKMKKYIKFILGLILITVILNPILKLTSNGEKDLFSNIKSYEDILSKDEDKTDTSTINTVEKDDKSDLRKRVFIDNFNKNCDNLLKNKFKNMKFKSETDCEIDFKNINVTIKKLKIGVADNKVSKIKKVVINEGKSDEEKVNDEQYSEIVNYVSDELNIPKDKIEVYQMKSDSN